MSLHCTEMSNYIHYSIQYSRQIMAIISPLILELLLVTILQLKFGDSSILYYTTIKIGRLILYYTILQFKLNCSRQPWVHPERFDLMDDLESLGEFASVFETARNVYCDSVLFCLYKYKTAQREFAQCSVVFPRGL